MADEVPAAKTPMIPPTVVVVVARVAPTTDATAPHAAAAAPAVKTMATTMMTTIATAVPHARRFPVDQPRAAVFTSCKTPPMGPPIFPQTREISLKQVSPTSLAVFLNVLNASRYGQ